MYLPTSCQLQCHFVSKSPSHAANVLEELFEAEPFHALLSSLPSACRNFILLRFTNFASSPLAPAASKTIITYGNENERNYDTQDGKL